MIADNDCKSLPISDSDTQACYSFALEEKALEAKPDDRDSNTRSDFDRVSGDFDNPDTTLEAEYCGDVTFSTANLMAGWSAPIKGGKIPFHAKVSQVEYKTIHKSSMPSDAFLTLAWAFKKVALDTQDVKEYKRNQAWSVLSECQELIHREEILKGELFPSETYSQLVTGLKKAIHCPITYKLDYPKDMPDGMRVTHCTEGACGSRILYGRKEVKQKLFYQCYIFLTQSLMDSWSYKETGNFMHNMQKLFINTKMLKCSRIDVRIDDRRKNWFVPKKIMESVKKGNYSGFKNHQLIWDYNDNWTQYLGSPKSDSLIRIYETMAKHGDWGIRWERQCRGEKAAIVHWELANKFRECFSHLPLGTATPPKSNVHSSEKDLTGQQNYLRHVASLAIGNVSFSDKWFQEVTEHIQHEKISYAVVKEPHCLRTRGGWINKNFPTTLAMIGDALGLDAVLDLCKAMVAKGIDKLNFTPPKRRRQYEMMRDEIACRGMYALGFEPSYEFVG